MNKVEIILANKIGWFGEEIKEREGLRGDLNNGMMLLS